MRSVPLALLLLSTTSLIAGDDGKSWIWWWRKGDSVKGKSKGKQESVVHHYHHYVKGAHRPASKKYVLVVPIKVDSQGYDEPEYDWDYYGGGGHGGHSKSKGFFKHRSDSSLESLIGGDAYPGDMSLLSGLHRIGGVDRSRARTRGRSSKSSRVRSSSRSRPDSGGVRYKRPKSGRNREPAKRQKIDIVDVTSLLRRSGVKGLAQDRSSSQKRSSRR